MKRGMKSLFRKCEELWGDFEYDLTKIRKNRHKHNVYECKKGRIRAILKREANQEVNEI